MELLRLVKIYSLAELRAIPDSVARMCEVILMPSMKRYIFNQTSVAPDDGDSVIVPNDDLVGCCKSGRWILETSSGAGGGGGGGGSAMQVVRMEFSGGAADYDVPTGFTPKLVIVHSAVQWNTGQGSISAGTAVGTGGGDQSCTSHGEADSSAHSIETLATTYIIFHASPTGSFTATLATITQMDATRVRLNISQGSATFTVTVIG